MRRAIRSPTVRRAMVAELRRGFDPVTGRHDPAAVARAAAILKTAIANRQPVRTGLLARSVRSRVRP